MGIIKLLEEIVKKIIAGVAHTIPLVKRKPHRLQCG